MISLLQKKRLEYRIEIPQSLRDFQNVCWQKKKGTLPVKEDVRNWFPKTCDQNSYELVKRSSKNISLRIGVVFSGGQAAGGHNVIAAIWDAIAQMGDNSQLIGFLDGPSGIVENRCKELRKEEIDGVRNLGGFDLIGSGRTKIETPEQLKAAMKNCQGQKLDGLIVIGGDDSNTNAAILAEYFVASGCETSVIGIPKTIDGDLQSQDIEMSFGFDSACKTYAEMIGNIARDALSAKKYYHFIKLMGRSASHITLECALATHPNLALIGEEQKSLKTIIEEITDLICYRSSEGKEYGLILIPEGLIEFIPEMKQMIQEINCLMVDKSSEKIIEKLEKQSRALFLTLPESIQQQLLFDRDPHGNVALSQIETEHLLIDLVKKELAQRNDYQGKFSPLSHFFGYEGRCCFPSNFDAKYCYSLGLLAALAVRDKLTGVICSIQNLKHSIEKWQFKMVPIVQLIHIELRKGKRKPVIEKTLVNLREGPYSQFAIMRKALRLQDDYIYPGPMQFFGDFEITDSIPRILCL